MRAALLPDRSVLKVAGDNARNFLHGLVTADIRNLAAGEARFCALLTPQGKIIADFIVAEAPAKDGGGFFIDVAHERAGPLVEKLNLYKLRAKIIVEDLSAILGVLAAWDGPRRAAQPGDSVGLGYPDPRLLALGLRVMLPPHLFRAAAGELGAAIVTADEYETHRIALGIPRGGVDFHYDDAFPHEADMDQLGGVDFEKGCYVGQEVVSRMEHRGTARTRAVPVSFEGTEPPPGSTVVAGDRQLGLIGSAAAGKAVALLRLDRVADAVARGEALMAGATPIRLIQPDWARFTVPGQRKAAE
ncbi:MAG: folate-binding protein [Xanthobacteraceae bacterium]